jgi:hypothetical protein
MILTKKRVATIEALNERFGSPETITRNQIMTALEEGLIPAFPYWLTDDLSLKVDRGVWHLPTPDEFTIAEKGTKASAPATRKSFIERGETPPAFIKSKPVKDTKKVKKVKPAPADPTVPEVMTDVVTVTTVTKKDKKSKSAPIPLEVVPEAVPETVSATV